VVLLAIAVVAAAVSVGATVVALFASTLELLLQEAAAAIETATVTTIAPTFIIPPSPYPGPLLGRNAVVRHQVVPPCLKLAQ
jgi:hypothetical protein